MNRNLYGNNKHMKKHDEICSTGTGYREIQEGAEAEIASKLKANAKTDKEIEAINEGIKKIGGLIVTGKIKQRIIRTREGNANRTGNR